MLIYGLAHIIRSCVLIVLQQKRGICMTELHSNQSGRSEIDYYGRVKGWIPIKKKPKLFICTPLGGRVCSKCGKLYMDTWSLYCCLDGKWLISIECLDFERRKMLGFDKPSRMNKELIVQP